MRYFENARPYVVTLPCRPFGGIVVLQLRGRGPDVVEGEYYVAYSKALPGEAPILREIPGPVDPSRIAYSQTTKEAAAKPIRAAGPAPPAPVVGGEDAPPPEAPPAAARGEDTATEYQDDMPGDEAPPADEGEGDDILKIWALEHGEVTEDNLKKAKVADLRALVEALDIESGGKKADLIAAILEGV